MEKADIYHHHRHQYSFMLMKRKEIMTTTTTHFEAQQPILMMNSSSSLSWEEKAFAEEYAAAGSAGGCIWPPRSYSCNFCMREFRSAQALGGHMNIHRRDRARLKQCLNITPNCHDLDPHDCPSSEPSIPLDSTNCLINPSARAPSRLSFLSPCFERKEDNDDDYNHDHVETDLCMGLNLSVVDHGRNKPIVTTAQFFRDEDEDDDYDTKVLNNINTTPKAADVFPLEFFVKPSYTHDPLHQSKVIGANASSNNSNIMDDLDLELRLGDPHKIVK